MNCTHLLKRHMIARLMEVAASDVDDDWCLALHRRAWSRRVSTSVLMAKSSIELSSFRSGR
eukprot:2131956-Amphidinium_carterae.1